MKLFRYEKSNGEFDYDRYKNVQEAGNIKKLNSRWVHVKVIEFLSKWLAENINSVECGLCHGTRGGYEQRWFREFLGSDVIGTEISSTATQFPHTIEWDFHEVKSEWIDKYDFIYSNSYDHSYDPEKCFSAWGSCLRIGGVMLLEHSDGNTSRYASELDPFGAERFELVEVINNAGNGKFMVDLIIDEFPFEVPPHLKNLSIIVVRRVQ